MGGAAEGERIPLGAILAGGRARRMGGQKVMLPLLGVPLIERVRNRLTAVCGRVVTVGGNVQLDGAESVEDRYPGAGSMGGIATALWYAETASPTAEWVLCVGCDMPFLEAALLLHLYALREGADIVVPRVTEGYEPLCAFYRTSCLPPLEELMGRGNLRIFDLFGKVRTRVVGEAELRSRDVELQSFINVNSPDDLERARRMIEDSPGHPPRGTEPQDQRRASQVRR